ncbi:hypothetical protein FNV43_RR12896 [Rhamnella rubrinervis]|uniref:Uncharacterized protein n=1 Tax=Rhamnella rubrinervis TaxID=2594499 RepID=A0A8K0H043_9ROSA|nr:hypothetical protein FNV43_RR12896 [Rhamnella rubrinervis]
MRGCPARRANNSHTYTLIGFLLAFMLWGYETIPPIATMFGIKSKDITCPRLLNWTTTGFATTKKLDPIFSKPNMKVINALEPTPSEMDFVQSIHWPTGRRPYDAPPIVAEKKSNDAMKESKRGDANAVKKFDGDDDIIGGDDYGMDHGGGDDYGMDHGGGDKTLNVQVEDNTKHVDTTPLPDVSRPSSPITFDHSVRVFTKMSPAKLASGRRKRRAARDIHVQVVTHLIRQRMEITQVFNPRILLLDNRLVGNDIELEYFGKLLPMFPYLIHAAGFYRKLNMPFSPRPFTISLASKCPQMHTDIAQCCPWDEGSELHVLVDSAFALALLLKLVEVENEDLIFNLETIVDKFREEMTPYTLGLCQNLVRLDHPNFY